MVSFEEILNRPASEIKRPEPLPHGTYHCLVDGPPTYGKSSKKETDYVRFKCKILGIMGDVDAKLAAEQQVVGKFIDYIDFYITDPDPWRLQEFLVDHLGIELGTKSLKELLAEAAGRQVLIKLRHEISQDGKRKNHRVDSTARV